MKRGKTKSIDITSRIKNDKNIGIYFNIFSVVFFSRKKNEFCNFGKRILSSTNINVNINTLLTIVFHLSSLSSAFF